MNLLGTTHLAFAIAALALGAGVVLMRKGTRIHRYVGRSYVAAMLAMNGTALMIHRLFDGFGPFHWLALFSLATVLAGLLPVLCRKPVDGWRFMHAEFMSWSYVGLVAAAVSETTTRVLDYPFGWTVAASSAVVVLIGAMVLRRGVDRAMVGARSA